MSEIIKNNPVFSLVEVMRSVQRTVLSRYGTDFWVKAEMNKLNYYKQSGHCHPDLVEKKDNKIIAQMRAIIWNSDYRRINDFFCKTLNEPLKDGIKIMFRAKITFEIPHGLTLRILDIDPDYTLGDLEKEKNETIWRMKQEGIFNQNKSLKIPLLPQRIAIISVETSKGYKDFLGKIDNNPWKYPFFHMLFPSVLQGEGIIRSIAEQLNLIRTVQDHFDAVAIVRGGGGEIGLASYNNYQLAKEIATFPLPVLTGIGHITNETVVEMVAHKNLTTPTDLADFLLQKFHYYANTVNQAEQKLISIIKRYTQNERMKIENETKHFHWAIDKIRCRQRNQVDQLQEKFVSKLRQMIREEHLLLDGMAQNVNNLSPEAVMKRGYSMTIYNGKAVKDARQLKVGDILKTVVYEGSFLSNVQTTQIKIS
jgi:exodeoxyribonuclease VII large subunit